MTEYAAHEIAASRDCKVDGCRWDAVDRRGRYAGLCSEHKRDAVAAARVSDAAARQTRRESGAGGAVIAAAQEVVAASRALERSLEAIRSAEERQAAAAGAWRVSVAKLLATAKPLIEAG